MININKYETLTQALQSLVERGFNHNFKVVGNTIKCLETEISYVPNQVKIVEHHRFEGASNPDDMEVLYAIECEDGTLGTIVDAYGSYADHLLANFLRKTEVQEGFKVEPESSC